MLLTGIAAGGMLALGTQFYRARQPRKSLIATLRSDAIEETTNAGFWPPAMTAQTVALGGLAAGGSLLLVTTASGLTPLLLANRLLTLLCTSRYGPLLYIAADTVRPLTFFPDSLMTVTGGVLFGPIWGTVYSIIGDTASAMLTYTVGKHAKGSNQPVRHDPNEGEQLIARYGKRMQDSPFESMIIMRGLFLHFDAVSFLAGYLHLDWKPFLLGTVIGGLPSSVACVLFGASLEGTTIGGGPRLNPVTLAASGVVLIGSLGISSMLRKREVKEVDAA